MWLTLGLLLLGSPVFYWWVVNGRRLSPAGAAAAIGIAWAVGCSAGPLYLLPLLLFFGSSALIGRLYPSKPAAGNSKQARPRDATQVLANGGWYALAAILTTTAGTTPGSLFAIMAAATADTWSSELGQYFGGPTYDIVRLRRVPVGLSGGISLAGCCAGLGGAGVIALLSLCWPATSVAEFALVIFVGFGGMLMDSLLGSWWQATYRDSKTRQLRDSPQPGDTLHGGASFITNDVVNALSLLFAWLTYELLAGLLL